MERSTTQAARGKWMPRFIWAAIAQGVAAVAWTLFIISPYTKPSPSYLIAGGGAGTWFTLGYVLYVMIGVIAVAVTGFFYYYIEDILGKKYSGLTNGLAWAHFALMNVGVAAATWALMYGGYVGGVALLPASEGGGNMTSFQVHTQILGPLVNPIGYLVGLATLGVALGGLGYLIRSRSK
jgi:heme/copper-type cytochrome/quinol oxidase subunit 1